MLCTLSKAVKCYGACAAPDPLARVIYRSLVDDGQLHHVHFALRTLATLRAELKANANFPPATGSTKRGGGDYMHFRRVTSVVAVVFQDYLPPALDAVREHMLPLRARGMEAEWKAIPRHRSFALSQVLNPARARLLLVVALCKQA